MMFLLLLTHIITKKSDGNGCCLRPGTPSSAGEAVLPSCVATFCRRELETSHRLSADIGKFTFLTAHHSTVTLF